MSNHTALNLRFDVSDRDAARVFGDLAALESPAPAESRLATVLHSLRDRFFAPSSTGTTAGTGMRYRHS